MNFFAVAASPTWWAGSRLWHRGIAVAECRQSGHS